MRALVFVPVLLALVAAGCGGAKAPSVASLATTSTSSTPTSTSGAPTAAGGAAAGSSGPQTSSAAGGTLRMVGGSVQELTKLSICMRKNGVPNFPDPNAQGQISITGIDPGSAKFQQAQQVCRKLMPNGGTPSPAQQQQARTQALAFSACMRSHGEPNFPDPQFGTGGSVRLKLSAGSGLDPSSPQFQAAQKACQGNLPGKGLGQPASGVGPKG